MLTKNFSFKDFKRQKKNKKLVKYIDEIILSNNEIIKSLQKNYKNSYKKKIITKLKKFKDIRVFGMGC